MMMMTKRFVLLSLLLVLAACTEPTTPTNPLLAESGASANGVSLSVNGVRFRHGDTIEVKLVNNGSASVGYNLCASARDRSTGAGWETIEPLRMCTAAIYPLVPGATALSREPVDPDWGTGKYRIATSIYGGEPLEPRRLTTAEFEVSP